ncbi:MAG: glutamate racemase [Candidatus Goldbacteria bacterium]|nr:glutamate racemase [Candidatus Goldiibacteriota bacterium]
MNNKRIGVFDSGVGGLTVVKELIKQLPNESICYLGDTARAPYGSKTKDTIIRFSIENVSFLLKRNVKIIVVACNTSSAIALDELRKNFKINIIGVVEAGARAAIDITRNKRIGIIGTKATIESKAYEKIIKMKDKNIKIFSYATPLLVPLVEEGWLEERETELILRRYLKYFNGKNIDTLLLGCTHYPLLKNLIKKIMLGINIIDSAIEISKTIRAMLESSGMLASRKNNRKHEFYVTDTPDKFNKIAKMFLKNSIISAKKIDLRKR